VRLNALRCPVDYLFGEQPMEEQEIPWERQNKFREDWIPEAMPELEAMVNEEL